MNGTANMPRDWSDRILLFLCYTLGALGLAALFIAVSMLLMEFVFNGHETTAAAFLFMSPALVLPVAISFSRWIVFHRSGGTRCIPMWYA